MANVLITGGCGFFGAWIIRNLLTDQHNVTVWDLEQNPSRWKIIMNESQIKRINFKRVKIEDTDAVQAAMKTCSPDAIIHLAGLQVPTCKAHPLAGATVNVLGTLSLFEAARSLPNPPGIAYASSAAVFGSDADHPNGADDNESPLPGTLYGAFKRCNELCARVYWKDYGLKTTGLRPLTVYGPGRNVGMTSFPTRAIAAALLKTPFEIPFSGKTAYTYVEEVASYFVTAALHPPENAPAYTISGEIVDTQEYVNQLEHLIPGAATLIKISGGDLPITAHLKDENLRTAIPGIERVSLADGIARSIEFFTRLKATGTLEV